MENNHEKVIKELQEQLATAINERDNLAAELATIKNGGFDFQKAMARIRERDEADAVYREQMQTAFDEALHTTTKYI